MSSIRETLLGPILRTARHAAGSDRFLWPIGRFILAPRCGDGTASGLVTTADGFRMHLNLCKYPGGAMYFGTFEIPTIRLIRRLLRSGDTALDVGANIGYVTAHMSRAVGNAGKVISFEPVPPTYSRLQETVTLNGLSNVETVMAGCSAAPGEFPFYVFPEATEDRQAHSSMAPLHEGQVAMTCRTVRLEGHVSRPVRLIKIDVEGAELGVVQGAKRIIAESKPHLIIEHNPEALAGFKCSFEDVVKEIRSAHAGYKIRAIDGFLGHRETAGGYRLGNLWFEP